jgi:hypothetical protein
MQRSRCTPPWSGYKLSGVVREAARKKKKNVKLKGLPLNDKALDRAPKVYVNTPAVNKITSGGLRPWLRNETGAKFRSLG